MEGPVQNIIEKARVHIYMYICVLSMLVRFLYAFEVKKTFCFLMKSQHAVFLATRDFTGGT